MKKEHGKIRYISTRVSVLTGMILLGSEQLQIAYEEMLVSAMQH